MKECSAYCEPELNIHTQLGFCEVDVPLDVVRAKFLGVPRKVVNLWGGESCYPLPAVVVALSIEEAVEIDEQPPRDCGPSRPILIKLKVVAA